MSLASLRPAAALAGSGYRRWSTYRQAAVAGVLVNTVFGVIKLSILLGVADSAGGAVFGFRVPSDGAAVLLLPMSVTLAVVVSFAGRFIVNLAAFWLTEVRGLVFPAYAGKRPCLATPVEPRSRPAGRRAARPWARRRR